MQKNTHSHTHTMSIIHQSVQPYNHDKNALFVSVCVKKKLPQTAHTYSGNGLVRSAGEWGEAERRCNVCLVGWLVLLSANKFILFVQMLDYAVDVDNACLPPVQTSTRPTVYAIFTDSIFLAR